MGNPDKGGYEPPQGETIADSLGSIPKRDQYMEHFTDGTADRVKVAGDKSYPLGEGERLVMKGDEPFIRKDGIDTPFEEWKEGDGQ